MNQLARDSGGCESQEGISRQQHNMAHTYHQILFRIIVDGNTGIVRAALPWLLYGKGSFRLDDDSLQAIAEFDILNHSSSHYAHSFDHGGNPQRGPDLKIILSDLLDIMDVSTQQDRSEFIHDSWHLESYLSSETCHPEFKMQKDRATTYRLLLETCLAYIMHCTRLSESLGPENAAALEHACRYWPEYAQMAFSANACTPYTRNLLMSLFRESGAGYALSIRHGFSKTASNPESTELFSLPETPVVSPAWFCTYYQIPHLIELLSCEEHEINLGIDRQYNGVSPLHYASESGSKMMVECLLDEGANIEAQAESNRRTALHYNAEGVGWVSTILLDRGANLLARDEDGATPLHLAVRRCDLITAMSLISRLAPNDLDAKDSYGLTALHLAVRIVEMCRVRSDCVAIIQHLLEHGADPNTQTYSGRSALQETARYESEDIYALLIKYAPESTFERDPRTKLWDRVRAFANCAFWNRECVTPQTRAKAYTNVVSITLGRKNSPRNARSSAEILYWNARDFIASHVREIACAGARIADEKELCDFYCREWVRYKKAAQTIDKCFAYVNRHLIRRLLDEGNNDVCEIEQLHYELWKEYFLGMGGRVMDVLRDFCREDESGSTTASIKRKVIFDSLESVGIRWE